MLVPEAIEVLGGMVQELEVARQHLVEEVNKPPRGKRYFLTFLQISNILLCMLYIAMLPTRCFSPICITLHIT